MALPNFATRPQGGVSLSALDPITGFETMIRITWIIGSTKCNGPHGRAGKTMQAFGINRTHYKYGRDR